MAENISREYDDTAADAIHAKKALATRQAQWDALPRGHFKGKTLAKEESDFSGLVLNKADFQGTILTEADFTVGMHPLAHPPAQSYTRA